MGYDVHITRANDWVDSESHPITFDEWSAFVEQDPELRMDGHADVVKNPDDEILGKMKQIARHFQAYVIGDDGESY